MEYPTLQVAAESVYELSTAGQNRSGQHEFLDPRNGVPYNADNSTVFATISRSIVDAPLLVDQQPASWVESSTNPYTDVTLPARWAYEVAANVLLSGQGTWLLRWEVYGPMGLTDTHLATFFYTLEESIAGVR